MVRQACPELSCSSFEKPQVCPKRRSILREPRDEPRRRDERQVEGPTIVFQKMRDDYPSITSGHHPELIEGPLGGKDDLFI